MDSDRSTHDIQEHVNATRIVEALKDAELLGERARDQANFCTGFQAVLEP
jgi:hypothetical protein